MNKNQEMLWNDLNKIAPQIQSKSFKFTWKSDKKQILVKFKNIEFKLWILDNDLTLKILNQNPKFTKKTTREVNLCYQTKNNSYIKSASNVCLLYKKIYLIGTNIRNNISYIPYSYNDLENLLVALDDWNINCPELKEDRDEIRIIKEKQMDKLDKPEVIEKQIKELQEKLIESKRFYQEEKLIFKETEKIGFYNISKLKKILRLLHEGKTLKMIHPYFQQYQVLMNPQRNAIIVNSLNGDLSVDWNNIERMMMVGNTEWYIMKE